MKIEYTEIEVNDWDDIPESGAFLAIWPKGAKEWWVNGKLHREDGPAVEYSSGSKTWWLDNEYYSEQDFYKKLFELGKISEEEYFLHLL